MKKITNKTIHNLLTEMYNRGTITLDGYTNKQKTIIISSLEENTKWFNCEKLEIDVKTFIRNHKLDNILNSI